MPRTEKTRSGKRVPVWIKIVSWSSLIIISMLIGYWGAGFLLERGFWKSGFNFGSNSSTQLTEGKTTLNKDIESSKESVRVQKENIEAKGSSLLLEDRVRKVVYLYLAFDGGLKKVKTEVLPDIMEAEIKQTLSKFFDMLMSERYLGKTFDVKVLHVFRDGEKLYLDLNSEFLAMIKYAGKDKAKWIITALIKTLVDNFPPVMSVMFLVDGREVKKNASPLDFSKPWRLPEGGNA